MLKKLLIISITVNALFLILCGLIVYKKGFSFIASKAISLTSSNETKSENTPYFKVRNSIFSEMDTNGGIIFIGDSLVDNNEWSESIGNAKIYNRGIGGDTTYGVISRLKNDLANKPQKLLVMVGINDLSLGITKEEIINNYSEIIDMAKASSSNIEVFIHSILPINTSLTAINVQNDDIIKVNDALRELASTKGVGYIDVHSSFVNKNNELDEEWAVDGIHLKGIAYKKWEALLSDHIN